MRARRTVHLPELLAVVVLALSLVAAAPVASASQVAPHRGSNVDLVNPLIGTDGESATEYGGMIPSTAPPFAMTRWSPMTRQNWVSRLPYHHDDTAISGFIGTHQPAIWMGDYGYVTGMPGVGEVKAGMDARALPYRHEDEIATPSKYSVDLQAGAGKTLKAELTGTSRAGDMRFSYPEGMPANFVLEATRAGIRGQVNVDQERREITGYNPDRQDNKLGPFKAANFKGYFVASFDTPFDSYGTSTGEALHENERGRTDAGVGAYVRFPAGTGQVRVRIGTSFISVEQARENLRREIPAWRGFDSVAAGTRAAWSEKLDRVHIKGASKDQLANFYTGMFHALQYPSEMSEYGRYYSAYDDKVHHGTSYTSYSLWDTFRAQNAFLTLFAPERIDDMVTSMLQDYREGGWLPMWKNPTETNIMVGTNADSIIAEVLNKGFHGFDRKLAYEAVHKNAMTPPDRDTELRFADREEGTPVEARAGLTTYKQNGWVASDRTAEAGSRTLDYAFEDWAVAQVAKAVGKPADAEFFLQRSKNYRNMYNAETGFMQSRNFDGTWAEGGWTEGDEWVYTFDVMHDMPGLIELMGKDRFTSTLDRHFAEGHNNHTNEPSHHIAYSYDYAGQPWKTQEQVRAIAESDYANRPDGLSGNDDLGQMSAWYLLSAIGVYPVNPASDQYAVGSPFFDEVTLRLPGSPRPLVVSAPGNSASNKYVKSLRVNGKPVAEPFISQRDLTRGGELRFTMSPTPHPWNPGK
ncbi:GH92 family glycosyl hydrolase [Amycolatopsis nigrescens]|uniref:GH92 family glycosyl hydrolase n=1 Tax=Amycolatopsis nigrescens TaxID=381445 RepID=UPI0003780757|nr:GH92 family glycosyl hydrolase [Amycolatopsis nigrescens]